MTVEIKTVNIKPVRQTFAHLEARFGPKPATRYQEATFDVQPETNFHYKPLWDPEHEIFDKRRTAIVMADFYALKDPRQFFYGSYTMARAKQQEALDGHMQFLEKRDLLRQLPEAIQHGIAALLVPLRHYEWGANMANAQIAAYGWGTAITQAAMMATMDRLGMAQHLSRLGLLLDGNQGTALISAKTEWVENPAFQPLRNRVEDIFVTKDWFEVMVAQNLVADALVYPLFFQHYDARVIAPHGVAVSLALDYMIKWYQETAKWVDAVVKTAASESPENKALIAGWVAKWRAGFRDALVPLAGVMFGADGDTVLDEVVTAFDQRAAKLGAA
jgi:phenol hydroxylase P1 protein